MSNLRKMKVELTYLKIAGNGKLPQVKHFAMLDSLGFLFVTGSLFL